MPTTSAVAILGASAVVFIAMCVIFTRWRHQRQERAIRAFRDRMRANEQEFLRDLGLAIPSPTAEKALAIRARLAELGQVPPESLRASDRLQGELVELPFYDSPDYLELLLILEKELGISIEDDEAQQAFSKSWKEITIRDVILAGVRLFERHREPT